jgi:NRAMP (natural resistance-associated macrophage protein)-like metal ion transporter
MTKKKQKTLLQRIGPGFVTGAADDDPSGIGTYSQTGAQFGYSQLWLAIFSFPFMAAVQEMCGRIGMVAGKGLAGVIRDRYSKWILWGVVSLLFFANSINIGADIGAMASAAQMLFGLPLPVWLFGFVFLILALELFLSYQAYARILKWLSFSLIAYIITAFMIKQPWDQIALATLIPSLSFTTPYLMNIVAVLGTTISPYLFFWQADEEVEEEIVRKKILGFGLSRPFVTKHDVSDMRNDTFIGMFFSNLAMFFIILTAASTLHVNGILDIQTATDAAEALRPLAGPYAHFIFTLGIISVGLLAVPILAGSASYAIAEAFGWNEGLSKKVREAPAFYAVIAVATVFGLSVNLIGIPPFKMLYYSAVLNGLISAPLLFFIVRIAGNQKVMGSRVNGRLSNILGWTIFALMSVAGLAFLGVSLFRNF